MTIQCISADRIWKEWGDWWMASLQNDRTQCMLEAYKAERISKQQNMFVHTLDKNDTNSIDWSCSVCTNKISIVVAKRGKHHWKDFLCDNCSGARWDPMMLRNLNLFHQHVKQRIVDNLKTDDDIHIL